MNTTTHKTTKTHFGYEYRGYSIEKRSDGTWSYIDWDSKGVTAFGQPRSYTTRFFTQMKFAKANIDRMLGDK